MGEFCQIIGTAITTAIIYENNFIGLAQIIEHFARGATGEPDSGRLQ